MNKLTIIVNKNGEFISYTNLEQALCSEKLPLIAYLEGSFSFKNILDLLTIPLIYAEKESIFDFTQTKDLFEQEIPNNFSLLVKRIGYANALEVLLSSSVYSAKEAYQLKLINKICTEQEFQEQVKRMSKLSLSAIDLALDLADRMPHLANAQAEVLERYVFALRFAHPDQKEGMQAFLEKRSPKFP